LWVHSEAVPVITVLEGGTDTGSMVIFDPATLPGDYDGRVRQDREAAIKQLFDHGSLYWLETGSNGAYELVICVGGSLPRELARFARPLGAAARFAAVSGRVYFSGIEYAFRHDDSSLRKRPDMGASLELPAGIYRLTLYAMDYPEDFHRDGSLERLSAGDFRLYTLINNGLIPFGCIGAIAIAVSFFLLGWHRFSVEALPVFIALAPPAILFFRSRSNRGANRPYLGIQREYPAYCATLEVVG
jgi:hypothetical protein